MNQESLPIPGWENGRRVERVEWGLRQTVGNFLMGKGEVDPRPSEENARLCEGLVYSGFRDTEVVKRTVVTYTSTWETAACEATELTADADVAAPERGREGKN